MSRTENRPDVYENENLRMLSLYNHGFQEADRMDNKWNIGQGGDMPVGFGLSLAANAKAMEAFSNMSDPMKAAAVEKSRQMHSREEMERYVDSLGQVR